MVEGRMEAEKKHVTPLWWVEEGKLAGMPMPWLDPARRENLGGAIDAYDDEMRSLWDAGVRSVACLLNIPSDQRVYESAGFSFLCFPIANGGVPADEGEVRRFIEYAQSAPAALAVHCQGGIGRTGTMIAVLLMAGGASFEEAVTRVRAAQPAAIETAPQMQFLEQCEGFLRA